MDVFMERKKKKREKELVDLDSDTPRSSTERNVSFLDTPRRSGNAAWRDQLVVQLKKTEKWNRSTEEEEKRSVSKTRV